MNQVKKMSLFLLLCLMTICMICLPPLMSEQSSKKLQSETIEWTYKMLTGTEITGEQVARLYYFQEINMGAFQPISLDKETQDIKMLFKTLFEDSEPICENMTRILSGGTLRYSRSNTLINLDNHPIALHFMEINVNAEDSVLKFTYEEKTKTVIQLSYASVHSMDDGAEEGMLEAAVKNYYEERLGLMESEYYFINDIAKKEEWTNYYTGFGILQCSTDDGKKTLE